MLLKTLSNLKGNNCFTQLYGAELKNFKSFFVFLHFQ